VNAHVSPLRVSGEPRGDRRGREGDASAGAGPAGAEQGEQGQAEAEGQEGQAQEAAEADENGAAAEEEPQEPSPEDHCVRCAPDPGQPTRGERSRHELTHLPFRPWCKHCVDGRAPDDPHGAGPADEERGVPKVSLDYAYMKREGEEEQRTILVVKARPSRAVASRCVVGKGREDPAAVPWVVAQLRRLGLGRCVLQADGEPATRAFVKDIIEDVCRDSTMGVAGAHSPAHDHKANGDVERAVREVKNQVRVMDSALTSRVGPVPSSRATFEWMVEWAGELITGALVGHDGMTGFRRLRGRDWTPKIAEFGEQVLARRPQAREQQSLEPRWDQATYLGTRWGTVEHWVADADGRARKVHTIRRVPENARWVPERVLGVTGVPDEPGRLEAPGQAPAPVVVVPAAPEEAAEPARLTRGFFIQQRDLVRHGYTQNCPKCEAIRRHRHVGTGHSAACRERFRGIFEADNDSRVQRAQARRDEALQGPAEAAEGAEDEDQEMAGDAGAPVQQPAGQAPGAVAEGGSQALPLPGAVRAEGPDEPMPAEEGQAAHPGDMQLDSVIDLISAGAADPLATNEEVRRLCLVAGMTENEAGGVVTELFSPPRLNRRLQAGPRRAGLLPGTSFDLIRDEVTGEQWNFFAAGHRRRCWQRLKQEDPWVVIGSPPCTSFCRFNFALNYPRMNPQDVKRRKAEGMILVRFALDIYLWQLRRGRYFMHEHPESAVSWGAKEVRDLLRQDGVTSVANDACMFGMKAVDSQGVEGPAKKPTRWMGNAPRVMRELSKRCRGHHAQHVHLTGGRAAGAAVYPPELVAALIRGLHAQRVDDARARRRRAPLDEAILNAMRAETATPQPIQRHLTNDISIQRHLTSDIFIDRPASPADFHCHWSQPCLAAGAGQDKPTYDEYTGEVLDPVKVAQGKREELQFFDSKEVWHVVPRAAAGGKRVVGTRWVCSNKGDEARPDVRCRLVCQEVKTYETEEFYAATPPSETLRMILSFAAENPALQVSLVDISRAYFNAEISREVFVELPPEAGYGRGCIGKLVKCLYGTRDAAQGWERTYREVLEGLGFRRGRSSPCVFQHKARGIRLTVHGDDFFSVGLPAALKWFEEALLEKFEGKVKGKLAQPGDGLRVLNRVARITREGYEWEADQRHAEILVREAGLAPDSRALSIPGRKATPKERDEEAQELKPSEATQYRALVARANFLSGETGHLLHSQRAVPEYGKSNGERRGSAKASVTLPQRQSADDPALRVAGCSKRGVRAHRQRLGWMCHQPEVHQRRRGDARKPPPETLEQHSGHSCAVQRRG